MLLFIEPPDVCSYQHGIYKYDDLSVSSDNAAAMKTL